MELKRGDITDNIIIIKINRSYRPGMSAESLYDAARGCWNISIPYASVADYALAVSFGEVKEVYMRALHISSTKSYIFALVS
ncbi:MAG: hypothetical protein IKI86_02225 [Firmicutes bacterium]|nr:hypothetical protein [Bacillota bacterium]